MEEDMTKTIRKTPARTPKAHVRNNGAGGVILRITNAEDGTLLHRIKLPPALGKRLYAGARKLRITAGQFVIQAAEEFLKARQGQTANSAVGGAL
jgi:hypothetical protein